MPSTREPWMGFDKPEPTHQALHWLFKPSPNQMLLFEACKLFLITHPFWFPANFPPWKGLRTRRKVPSYPQGGSILESCKNASQEIPLLAFQIHQLESSGKHPKILGSPPNGNWIPNLCNRVRMHFRPLTVNLVVLWCEVLDWRPIVILWSNMRFHAFRLLFPQSFYLPDAPVFRQVFAKTVLQNQQHESSGSTACIN